MITTDPHNGTNTTHEHWRADSTVGRTIYAHHGSEDRFGTLIGVMDTPNLADVVVTAVNEHLALQATVDTPTNVADRILDELAQQRDHIQALQQRLNHLAPPCTDIGHLEAANRELRVLVAALQRRQRVVLARVARHNLTYGEGALAADIRAILGADTETGTEGQ